MNLEDPAASLIVVMVLFSKASKALRKQFLERLEDPVGDAEGKDVGTVEGMLVGAFVVGKAVSREVGAAVGD